MGLEILRWLFWLSLVPYQQVAKSKIDVEDGFKHGQSSIGLTAKIYIHQLCVDTGFLLEDLSRAMFDRNGLQERVEENL